MRQQKELEIFFKEMLAKANLPRMYKKQAWDDLTLAEAEDYLIAEIKEWHKATNYQNRAQELVDVAICCAMCFHLIDKTFGDRLNIRISDDV
jgi:hypothetical protein